MKMRKWHHVSALLVSLLLLLMALMPSAAMAQTGAEGAETAEGSEVVEEAPATTEEASEAATEEAPATSAAEETPAATTATEEMTAIPAEEALAASAALTGAADAAKVAQAVEFLRKQEYGLIPATQAELARTAVWTPPAGAAPSDVYGFFDNSQNYPTARLQIGGSCTAWATAYAYKTMQEKADHNWSIIPESHQFSPTYVYNQLNGGQNVGIGIIPALELIRDQGVCSYEDMPATDDFALQPNDKQRIHAMEHHAASVYRVDGIENIKSAIYYTGGAVIAIHVYPDFYLTADNQVYDVQEAPYEGYIPGYHAICLTGFDDRRQAFSFINSWGADWGVDGGGWISYNVVRQDEPTGFIMTDYDEPVDTIRPVISNFSVTSITSDGYWISFSVSDNVAVGSILFGPFTSKNWTDDYRLAEVDLKLSGRYSVYVKTSEHNNESGEYLNWFVVYDTSGNYIAQYGTTVNVPEPKRDTSPPAVSNVRVSNLSETGYTLSFTVTDETQVAAVYFGPFTSYNWTDDCTLHQLTVSPYGYYSFDVHILDHNYESGEYLNWVYAYDSLGNIYNGYANKVEVPKDTTPPSVTGARLVRHIQDGFTVEFKASDNVEVASVWLGVWTDKDGTDDFRWFYLGNGSGNYLRNFYRWELNGEYGGYRTSMYVYDINGNGFAYWDGPSAYIAEPYRGG